MAIVLIMAVNWMDTKQLGKKKVAMKLKEGELKKVD